MAFECLNIVQPIYKMEIKEGEKAPEFCLPDQDGKNVSLSELRKKLVVLYFYPRDNTPGCTIEALGFTRLKDEFEKAGAVVLGVSKDSVKSHQSFCEKRSLSITLLADEDAAVQKLYGVWGPKKFLGREF
jgi:thioredoxin-dependent peroxiredoxin